MPVGDRGRTQGNEWLSCRDVLWYLVFCGFAIDFILQANLGLAIVAMVVPQPQAAAIAQCQNGVELTSNLSELWVNASSVTNTKHGNVTYLSSSSLEPTTRPENTTPLSPVQYPNRFVWNEYEQGLALGAYFWLNWATQLPGGILARRYGTKFIFGWGNLGTALLGFLIPFLARYHLYAFVFIRVLQGLLAGVIWPSMHHMTAKWIPRNERSKFISSYSGNSVGLAVTYPLCAMLVNWFGWESVFYVTSVLGVVWYVAWYYLAYDSPQKHPRISEAEKTHILDSLGNSVSQNDSRPVPWNAILTSRYVWLTAMSQLGGSYGLIIIMAEAPSYFNYIHGWNISAAGILSAAPHIMCVLFAYVFSSFADWLLRTNRMSLTNLRKFAILLSNGVHGIMMMALAFSGCHHNLAIGFMIAGAAFGGASSAGYYACCIDLSPNYGSIILAIGNVMVSSSGFIGPLIVGILTNNNQTIEQWRLVFLIAALVLLLTGVLFIFFGTSDLQSWNDVANEKRVQELRNLRSKVGEVEYDKNDEMELRNNIGDRQSYHKSKSNGENLTQLL